MLWDNLALHRTVIATNGDETDESRTFKDLGIATLAFCCRTSGRGAFCSVIQVARLETGRWTPSRGG